MLRGGRLARAKAVLAQLMQQAYCTRARVALLHLSGAGVALVLAPQRAGAHALQRLGALGGGGGTPLAAALAQADALLQRHEAGPRRLWLLTDGRCRQTPARPRHAEQIVLVDFEDARLPLGRGAELAAHWGATHWPVRATAPPRRAAAE